MSYFLILLDFILLQHAEIILSLREEQKSAGFNQFLDKLGEKDPDCKSWWTDYVRAVLLRTTYFGPIVHILAVYAQKRRVCEGCIG